MLEEVREGVAGQPDGPRRPRGDPAAGRAPEGIRRGRTRRRRRFAGSCVGRGSTARRRLRGRCSRRMGDVRRPLRRLVSPRRPAHRGPAWPDARNRGPGRHRGRHPARLRPRRRRGAPGLRRSGEPADLPHGDRTAGHGAVADQAGSPDRRRPGAAPPVGAPRHVGASPAAASGVDREEIELLLGRLDERERLLVRLHHLEARSYGEISRLTGMPLGSIGPALSRAKAKMRLPAAG